MPREASLTARSLSCGYTMSLPLGVLASQCFQNLTEFIRRKKKVVLRIFELQIHLKKILNVVITDLPYQLDGSPRDAGGEQRP